MNKTSIEYLTHTWNPIAMRCTPVSEGCRNCWHLAMAKRLAKNPTIDELERMAYRGLYTKEIIGEPVLKEKELEAPLRLRKSSRIGVQFMGDLFHESIHNSMISSVLFQTQQALSPHTFFILTKRPQRMKDYFNVTKNGLEEFHEAPVHWPTDNVWLGVSIEDQKTADERIPILLQIPAAHRWVSIEPMLGPVDLWPKLGPSMIRGVDVDGLNWAVLGGETGPGARPLHPDWVRSIRDQCQAARVPFFFKAWGSCPYPRNLDISDWIAAGYDPYEKNGGHFLDGQEWRQLPK